MTPSPARYALCPSRTGDIPLDGRVSATPSRAFFDVTILPRRTLVKRTQAIGATERGLFFINTPRAAIPFRCLTPKIDDLLLKRCREALRFRRKHWRARVGRDAAATLDCFTRISSEREAHTPPLFLRDHERELRMPAADHRAPDTINTPLARRQHREASIVQADNAAEAAAMHHAPAHLLHGYWGAGVAWVTWMKTSCGFVRPSCSWMIGTRYSGSCKRTTRVCNLPLASVKSAFWLSTSWI